MWELLLLVPTMLIWLRMLIQAWKVSLVSLFNARLTIVVIRIFD